MAAGGKSYTTPGIDRIWVVDDGVKVLRDDLDHPAASGSKNPVWDGEVIRLFGARNEVVAFQVILQSGPEGASRIDMEVSDLQNGEALIPGSAHSPEDPWDYRGRYVELLTAHYLEITERSTGGNAWTALAAPRTSYTGWVPDALIPFSAARWRGGTPFRMEPDRTQALWVDIWIPRTAQPGTYTGHVHVVSRGGEVDIPLELQVYGFTLPDESHVPNMFGLAPASIVRRFDLAVDTAAYYELETRFHQMAHRHRFDLVRDVSSLSKMEEFHLQYLDGSLYTPAFNYDGPGAGTGNRTFTIGLYGNVPVEYGGSWPTTEQDWQAGSDAWAEWFHQNAPNVSISKYLFPDEPESSGDFRKIRKQGTWTHSNEGPGGSIPTYVTHPVSERISDHVDIWSTAGAWAHPGLSPGTDMDLLAEELETGKQWAFYNGYRPISGCQVIDADAVEFRVIPWIMWKYDVDQYFYWMTTYWTQWVNNNKDTNVYVEAQTMEYLRMGAGTFFYPGRDMQYPSQDRGLDGPVSSIRMKNWRRGAQDYEYLYLAASLGLTDEVNQLVDELVPAALWEADLNGNISWPDTGYGFETIRRELADMIEAATDPGTLLIQSIDEYEEALYIASSTPDDTQKESSPDQAPGQRAEQEQLLFSDVPIHHEYREEIETLVNEGLLTACDYRTGRFCPDEQVTWLDMAVISLRAEHGPDYLPPAVAEFQMEGLDADTQGAFWIEQYYRDGFLDETLAQNHLVDPSASVMRMDAAILLLQLMHGAGYIPAPAETSHDDVPGDAWYRDSLAEAGMLNLLPACSDEYPDRLCPRQTLSRADAAAALYAVLEYDGAASD